MGENEFILLCTFMGENDDDAIDSRMKALTIEELVEKAADTALTSSSTVYKNIQRLIQKGLVKSDGIKKGRNFTYYITTAGKEYVNNV